MLGFMVLKNEYIVFKCIKLLLNSCSPCLWSCDKFKTNCIVALLATFILWRHVFKKKIAGGFKLASKHMSRIFQADPSITSVTPSLLWRCSQIQIKCALDSRRHGPLNRSKHLSEIAWNRYSPECGIITPAWLGHEVLSVFVSQFYSASLYLRQLL